MATSSGRSRIVGLLVALVVAVVMGWIIGVAVSTTSGWVIGTLIGVLMLPVALGSGAEQDAGTDGSTDDEPPWAADRVDD